MQTWLSYHIYPLETPEVFLTRGVRPFLEQHVWPVKGARAFFIRYDDEKGQHIRLRIRGEAGWLEQTLRPAFDAWFAERGAVDTMPYLPETERFGGPETIGWAEEYFHLSTRVVLDRMNGPYTYGDAMSAALRLHAITAFAAGWNREKSAWYFNRLCDQWMDLFLKQEDTAGEDWKTNWKELFENNFTPQREELRLAMSELWSAMEKGKFDQGQPEWLRWLRGSQMILPEFGEQLEKVLPSLLHLTNNRLGVNNQDEVYLNYLLS